MTGYSIDSSQSNILKRVATFYSATRTCGGSSGPDPLGRTLETRGPCFVNAETDTACASNHPVTVYEYYPASESTSNRNRLFKVRRYVGGSGDCASGVPLTTTYADYDPFGNAGTVTDENGNVASYTFDPAGRLTTRSKSGLVTRFAYDSDKLTRVMSPEGNGEVYCYRTSANDDCTTGTYTPKLQWRATKACTGTTSFSCTGGWSERVDLFYAPDGTVSREEYRACDTGTPCLSASAGTLRRVLRYSADAHRRPTWRGFGDTTGQFSSVSFFDRADNLAGVGSGFNNAASWCGGPNTGGGKPDEPVSKLCATLRYDRAERLASMTEYPTTASSGLTTCFGYDAHGNITAVHSGCAGTSGCASSGICTAQGASATSQYTYDDFGNLVFADLPWTSNGAGAKGRWVYNYDATGNVLLRRSPEQIAKGAAWQTVFGYDMLGRGTSARAETNAGNVLLWNQTFDSPTSPSNCPALTNTVGRVARRGDSLGDTYFSYDADGRLLSETRLKPFQTQCLTTADRVNFTPRTTYTYSSNGNLRFIAYPHERQVEYVYGTGADADRVAAVRAQKREAGAWNWYTVIDNVVWEPYAGLRRYQVKPPGGVNFTVEYRQGDNSEAAPLANSCTAVWAPAADDHTGRLRALWVSLGTPALGAGAGELLRLWYQWRGEVPVRKDLCLLQEATARTVLYGFDGKLQLSAADGGYPSGPSGSQGFVYDARGNRSAMTQAGASALTTTYALSSNGDRLDSLSRNDPGSGMSRLYGWDKNGRVTDHAFAPNSTGNDSFKFNYLGAENTTFSAVDVAGTTYSYSYDGLNRRGSKQYPSGMSDDFFYDTGHQLLADRGVADVATGAPYPVDEYVWLGGRPVVVVHGLFNSGWVRQDDNGSGTACQRNGEAQACGFYFPVSDVLGTVTLVLDSAARVTGTSEFDAFGYPNRGALSATTGAQPYAANQNVVLGSFQTNNGAAATSTQVRVRYSVLETEANSDVVRLEEVSGATGTNRSGQSSGPLWSDWLTLTSAGPTRTVNVRFVSNSSVQSAGVIAESFEYRRYSTAAATPFFTPLRFPGQYHDVETDFFENWNRYYEPFSGRYLQPEPLLQHPGAIVGRAREGGELATYAYASNNPVAKYDPDGLLDTWTTYCQKHPLDPACVGPPPPVTGGPGGGTGAGAGAGAKPAGGSSGGANGGGRRDSDCDDDDDDVDVICDRAYQECVRRGGDSLPGNHWKETRCGSCFNVCLKKGWWPYSIPSPSGGNWICPG